LNHLKDSKVKNSEKTKYVNDLWNVFGLWRRSMYSEDALTSLQQCYIFETTTETSQDLDLRLLDHEMKRKERKEKSKHHSKSLIKSFDGFDNKRIWQFLVDHVIIRRLPNSTKIYYSSRTTESKWSSNCFISVEQMITFLLSQYFAGVDIFSEVSFRAYPIHPIAAKIASDQTKEMDGDE
jgi:hypothetical protein